MFVVRPIIILILVTFFLLTNTLHAQPHNEPTTPGEKVRLQLKWYHQFQFAGFYAAQEKGYYQAAGLDVEILEGKSGLYPLDVVADGKAEYGLAGPEALLHRLRGKPIVALAVIFQHSPRVFVTRKDSGILSPQDVIGKTIRIGHQIENIVEIYAMFIKEGVSLDKTTLVDKWNINDFMTGKIAGFSGYLTNQPYRLDKAGIEFNIITPLTYGIDFYGDTIITSETELKNHPERAEAFRQASIKGWEYAMAHPDELIELIMTQYKASQYPKNRDSLADEAQKMEKLILPKLVQVGHMNPGRWEHIAQTYADLEIIDPHYSLEGFIYKPEAAKFQWDHWSVKLALGIASGTIALSLLLLFFNQRLRWEIDQRKQTEKSLRHSEAKINLITDSIPALIAYIRKDLRYEYVNLQYAQVFNLTPEEIQGELIQEILGEQRYQKVQPHIEKVLAGQPERFMVSLPTQNQEIRHMDSMYVPHVVDDTIVGFFALIIDITERIEFQHELKQTQAKLVQSAKLASIGELATGIAHELNQPLMFIRTPAQLEIREGFDKFNSQSAFATLKEIIGATDRMMKIIDHLRVFSRQAKDDPFVPVHIEDVIENSFVLLKQQLQDRNIRVEKNYQADLPSILGNPNQLEQVFLNMLTNARDALKDQEDAKITITTQKNEKRVIIAFEDNGTGIARNQKEKIFDPFFTTKEPGEGTGLGLSICHGIIQEHQGTIEVSSTTGAGQAANGTTMLISLPVSHNRPA